MDNAQSSGALLPSFLIQFCCCHRTMAPVNKPAAASPAKSFFGPFCFWTRTFHDLTSQWWMVTLLLAVEFFCFGTGYLASPANIRKSQLEGAIGSKRFPFHLLSPPMG